MLDIDYKDGLLKFVSNIKNPEIKEKIKRQIENITDNPEIGKPMRYGRKRAGEVHVSAFCPAYSCQKEQSALIFLEIYHKDSQ